MKMMVLKVMMFLLVMADTQITTPLVEQLRNLQAQALGIGFYGEEKLFDYNIDIPRSPRSNSK